MANRFWSVGPRNRVFLYGGLGTSLATTPLPTDQFALGTPFRLGAYERASSGDRLLRRDRRLPAAGRPSAGLHGRPVFAGGWLENGDAFDEWSHAGWRTNGGVGLVMDTLVGPVIVAGSWGFEDAGGRTSGVGRTFR